MEWGGVSLFIPFSNLAEDQKHPGVDLTPPFHGSSDPEVFTSLFTQFKINSQSLHSHINLGSLSLQLTRLAKSQPSLNPILYLL